MSSTDVPLVARAISYASRQHRFQLRKDDRTPYIAHVVRVMLTVSRDFGVNDEETLAAAVLHDTIEDTHSDYDEIADEFGPRVAGLVAALTKDKRLPEPEREEAYHAGILAGPVEAQLIKLADSLDNLIDAATMTGGRSVAKTLEKARRLVADLESRIPAPHRAAWEQAAAAVAKYDATRPS